MAKARLEVAKKIKSRFKYEVIVIGAYFNKEISKDEIDCYYEAFHAKLI